MLVVLRIPTLSPLLEFLFADYQGDPFPHFLCEVAMLQRLWRYSFWFWKMQADTEISRAKPPKLGEQNLRTERLREKLAIRETLFLKLREPQEWVEEKSPRYYATTNSRICCVSFQKNAKKEGPQRFRGPRVSWPLRLGSPETFEAKLEQAQHDLGIPSVEQIPIQSLDVLGSVGSGKPRFEYVLLCFTVNLKHLEIMREGIFGAWQNLAGDGWWWV